MNRSTYENLRRKAQDYEETGFRDRRFKARVHVAKTIAALLATEGDRAFKGSCKKIAAQAHAPSTSDDDKKLPRETVRRILKSFKAEFRRSKTNSPWGRWYSQGESSTPATPRAKLTFQRNQPSAEPDAGPNPNDRPQHIIDGMAIGPQVLPDVEPDGKQDPRQDESQIFEDTVERWSRKIAREINIEGLISEFVQARRSEFHKLVMELANRRYEEGPSYYEPITTEKSREWKKPCGRYSHKWAVSQKKFLGLMLRLSEEHAKGEVWCFVVRTGQLHPHQPEKPASYTRTDLRGRVDSAFSKCAAAFLEMEPKPSFAMPSWEEIHRAFADWATKHDEALGAAVADVENKRRLIGRLHSSFGKKLVHHLRVQLRVILSNDCRRDVEQIAEQDDRITVKPSWSPQSQELSVSDFRRILGETWVRKPTNFHAQNGASIWNKPAFKKLAIYAPYWEVIEQWERQGLSFNEVLWQFEMVKSARASRK